MGRPLGTELVTRQPRPGQNSWKPLPHTGRAGPSSSVAGGSRDRDKRSRVVWSLAVCSVGLHWVSCPVGAPEP